MPDGLFPVFGEGTGAEGGGLWFNWNGRRSEGDRITWDAPDGEQIVVGLVLTCPSCEKPFIFPGIHPSMWREDDEGRLSLATVLQCNGVWTKRDPASGQVYVGGDGRPMMERCNWVGVIRTGVAHHPQCRAVHLPHCQHPAGQACVCRMSRFDGNGDCHCGAITPNG